MAHAVYPKVALTTSKAVVTRLVRFLIGDTTGGVPAGGTWSLLRACDNGTVNEAPTDPHDIDSLPTAGNAWKSTDGAYLATGDWCVLQSAVGECGKYFQIFIQYTSTTIISFKLLPLASRDFGGGVYSGAWSYTGTSRSLSIIFASPPSGCVPSKVGTTANWTVVNGAANYSFVVDNGVAIMLADTGGVGNTAGLFYVGELDSPRETDLYPFVIYSGGSRWDYTYLAYADGNTVFHRLSPYDLSTWLSSGYYAVLSTVYVSVAMTDGAMGSEFSVFPVGVFFGNAVGIHYHFAGWLRHMGCYNSALVGISSTLDNRNWLCRSVSTSYPGLAIRWNGVTEYP